MSFKWFQNNSTVTISFAVAPTIKKADLEVAISLSSIKAGLKGSPPLCDGQLWSSIRSSKWALKNNAVVIHLEKISSGSKWPTLFHYPVPDTRPRVCVTYEYDAQDDTELTLRVGDVVIVTNIDSSGWWQGELAGKSGLFPSNFAEEMEYTPPVLSVEPPEDFAESEKAVALEEQGVPLVTDRKTMVPSPNSALPPVSVLPPAPVIATPPIPQEPEEETPQERPPVSNVTVVGSAVGVRMMPNIDELKNKLKNVNVGSNNPAGPPSAVGRGIAAQAPRGSKIIAPNQNANNPLSTSAGNSPFGRGGGSVRASVVPKQGLSNSQGDAPVSTPLNPTLKSSIAPRSSVIGFKNAPNTMQSKVSGSKFNVVQNNNSQQSVHIQPQNVSPVIPVSVPEPITTPSPQITRPCAKVVFDYEAEEESELALKEGDIVYILLKDESGWWQGEHASNGKLGWFPPNFVEEITEVQTTTLPPPPLASVLPPPVNDSDNDEDGEEGEEVDEDDEDVSSVLNSSGSAIGPKLVNPKQALLPLGPSGRKKPTKGSFVKDRNSLTSPMTQTPTPAPISPTTIETPTPKATPISTPTPTPSVKQPALKKAAPPPISSPSPAVRKTVMPNAALPSTPSQPQQQQPSPITTTIPPILNEEKEKEKEIFTTPPQQNIGGNQPNLPSNIIPRQIPLRPKVVPATTSVTSPTSQNRAPQINKTVPAAPSSNNQTNQNSTSNSSTSTSPQTQPLPAQPTNTHNAPSIPMPRWPNHLGSFSDFCSEITNIISEVIKNNSIPSHAQHYHHTFTPILPPVPSNSQVYQEGLILSPFSNSNTDSEALFASVCTVDGALFQSYEKDVYLPLLNCSAPFIYGLALKMHGKPHVHSYIGESTTNDPEAMITSNPPNPLTRAGMIVATSLILSGNTNANNSHPMTSWERINWVLNEFGGMSGARINANISTYQLLKERSTRDKAMINWLTLNGILSESVDVEKLLDFYFQLNSVEISVKQASIMAATLACDGVCPVTTEKCIDSRLSLQISNVLTSSGAFVRSNGSGLVMVVVPKVMGMAFYSPVIDSRTGLPVRAVELARNITQKYKL